VDSERALRAQFVRALDEVLPAAPWLEGAVFEDLRQSRGSTHRPRTGQMARRRPALRFAAALVLIALVAVAVGALVITRTSLLSGSQPQPGAPVPIEQYQAMTRADVQKLVATNSFTCSSFDDSTCLSNLAVGDAAARHWLDDLTRSQPPARYAAVDYLIRRHLALLLANDARYVAAFHARDAKAAKAASDVFNVHFSALQALAQDVTDPVDVTPQAYKTIVLGDRQALLRYLGLVACGSGPSPGCAESVTTLRGGVEGFQGDLARYAGPAQDARLQADLVHADLTLELVESALSASDPARLQAGLTNLRQWLARADADAAVIGGN
jgi:hypothetical protein